MKLIHSKTPTWKARIKAVTARCANCHRSRALRQLSTRKKGITMLDSWYCSASCFAAAAEVGLLRLLTAVQVQPNSATRMPLGLVLISAGCLTNEQLKVATDEQKECGGEIGAVLMRLGSVSEKQVTAARATQWGCPVLVGAKQISLSKIHIPMPLIQIYSMIPLHYSTLSNLLFVGFVHSIEYGLLFAIEQMTGCKTQPCFITPADFQIQVQQMKLLQERLGNGASEEVEIEGIKTPAEIAQTLLKYAVDFNAQEAIIRRCKDNLWARLKCGPRDIHLLFKAS
jgi:hypothetical protein